MKLEKRSDGKILEIRSEGEDAGICTAYLTKWDTVDSFKTTFERGSFANTFSKRGAEGTRLIWNHGVLAGKVLELREDEKGPRATVKFNLETDAGKTAYEHVRAKDVTCFSFGFNTVQARWIGNVRSIQEVDMLECGPVIFAANDEAQIVDVRSTDFAETTKEREVSRRGGQLLYNLEATIDDIYWSDNSESETIIALVDTAIAQFHAAYMAWLDEYYARFERRAGPPPRERRSEIRGVINKIGVGELVATTPLTKPEVENLIKGGNLPFESRSKLKDIPEELARAIKDKRRTDIENLCAEFRQSGFDSAEKERFLSLLELRTAIKTDTEEAVSFIQSLRNTFIKGK